MPKRLRNSRNARRDLYRLLDRGWKIPIKEYAEHTGAKVETIRSYCNEFRHPKRCYPYEQLPIIIRMYNAWCSTRQNKLWSS